MPEVLSGLVEVNSCPCGRPHVIYRHLWRQFRALTQNLPPDAKVTAEGAGSWLVPRVYIACHGLKPAELPGLAEQYGWPEVKGDG